MKTALWHGKRSIKQWQLQKQQDSHNQRLKNVRPTTHDWQWEPHTLNQNKRLMLQENKFTEIERENRYLLQKITHRMNRSITQRQSDKEKMNRSLNAPFRRKQLENIEVENARLLKRLQERKSDYETDKLKSMWKQQIKVIKNIAHYPFIIRTSIRGKKRAVSKAETQTKQRAKSNLDSDIELMRIRNIDGENFVVTVRFIQDKVFILGDHKKNKQKIIEIPKQEAIAFIEYECDGKLQKLFDRLSYNQQEDVLYLIGKQGLAGIGMQTIDQDPLAHEESKVSNF